MKLLLRPLGWLSAGMALAIAAGAWQARENADRAAARFDSLARRVVERVAARMHAYEYGLWGARGALFAAGGAEEITRLGFARYSASHDLLAEHPGALGFGFARRVATASEQDFVQAARDEGRPDFSIRQLARHAGERYVVQYVEPEALNRAAIGLDLASEPRRRAAAEAAMLTGAATLTAPITLVQADRKPLQSMLMLLPVLRMDAVAARQLQDPERRVPLTPAAARRDTVGWVFAPLVIDEVLQGFDYREGEYWMSLTDVTQPGQAQRFFSSMPAEGVAADLPSASLPLELHGRRWQVDLAARPQFINLMNQRSPALVAGVVAMLALLLALLSYAGGLTRRRHAQVVEQRLRLAAIVASSSDAIIGRDTGGRITDWNDAACLIFGYSADEAVGRTIEGLLGLPEHAAEERALMGKIAAGETVPPFETWRRRKDGTRIAVSVAAAPIRSPRGTVVGAAESARDITDEVDRRARAQELNATLEEQVAERTAELRALSARERAVLASAGSAIVATDARGRITLFNPAAEALLGYTAEQAVERMRIEKFLDAFEVRSRAAVLTTRLGRPLGAGEVFDASLAGEAPGAGEWTLVRRDGSRVSVHLDARPLRDGTRALTGYIIVATDLTERKRTETHLRASERFMRIVTDNIPAMVAYWDLQMRCTFANGAYRRWVGRGESDMIGCTKRELLGDEEFALDEPHVLAALAGHEQRVERVRTVDGVATQYWLHYIPDRDEDGVVKGMLSVAVDVSEMKQAQQQLELLNQALKERSVQAEAASRAKSEFLANMSHEIRSPLNVVIGLSYLMRQTALDDQQRSYLKKIEDASSALLSVVNDVLDISKIEAGQMALDESDFDLPVLLDEVVSLMAVGASTKGIELRLEADRALPRRVRGDQVRIRQILMNLVGNAIKFTSAGSVRLLAQVEQSDAARTVLRLAVIDTGVGIAPEVIGRLFNPFTQADMSTTRRFGGTGLGLSIVRQLVDLMDGRYGVRSEPGRGSEFWVQLPLARAASSHGEPDAPVAPVALPAGARLQGVRVLVVDDSPINLEVCQRILERDQAQVQLANDGLEAVEILRAAPEAFDVVLMDVHMPRLDGNEATRAIREQLGLAALPIIALSASALVAERNRALQAGMNDFVSKPFDAGALIQTLRHHLAAPRHAAAQLPAPGHPVPLAAQALPDDWPRIAGIDAQDAWHRLAGDPALLFSVLAGLLADFQDLADDPARAGADEPSLQRRMHKLRGSAGMIGARALAEVAAECETALAKGAQARAQQALLAVAAGLRGLARALQAHPAPPSAGDAAGPARHATEADPQAPVDPQALAGLLAELRRQNMDAIARFDQLAPALHARLGEAAFQALERAVRGLQFRRALQLLEAAGEAALAEPGTAALPGPSNL